MHEVQPALIRTLSEQHWHDATDVMFEHDENQRIAGTQGDWTFIVEKIPGEEDIVLRNTYYKQVLVTSIRYQA